MPQASPERNSRHGTPDLEDNRNRQSPGAGGSNYGTNRNTGQNSEEVRIFYGYFRKRF